ncbi:MAG: cyclic nucleotide-binding domain-containing protein [bacterium]
MEKSVLNSEKFDDHTEVYHTGETIFEEGAEGDSFFIIREGTVDIVKQNADREIPVATLGPEDIFGEMALIDDEATRSAAARAQTRVIVIEFSKDEFLTFLSQSKSFREFVLKLLVERIRNTNQRLQKVDNYTEYTFDSTHLMMAMMENKNWFAEQRKELELNLSEKLIREKFDLDHSIVEKLMSLDDSTELRRFSSDVQDEILGACETILNEGFRKLNITFAQSTLDTVKSIEKNVDTLEELLKTTKQLVSLLNNHDRLTQTQLRKIFKQSRKLESKYEDFKAKRSSDFNTRVSRKIDAHLEGLKRKISNINLHELED